MKRFFQVVGVNLAILLLGLVVIESIWRIQYADDIRYSLNVMAGRAYHFDVSELYPATETIHYSRDANGFRGAYEDIADIDLIVVGGSTTDQRFLDDAATWDAVLRACFREKAAKDVTIVNAGVDGQSTFGHLQNFDLWFSRFSDLRPGYILFYLGINDYYVGDTPHKKDHLVVEDPIQNFIRRSFSYYLVRLLRGMLQVEQAALSHRRIDFAQMDTTSVPLMPLARYEERLRDKHAGYAERVRALAQKTRALGARPIFVTQRRMGYWFENGRVIGNKTRPDKPNGVDAYHMMTLLNTTLMEVCREVDGICIDLAAELAFTHDDFYDYTHNNPQGARKVGTYLYDKLKDLY